MVRKAIWVIGLLAVSGGAAVEMSVAQSAIPAAATKDDSYRLGSGDKLNIAVYGEQELSGEQLVGPDGSVTLPLIGRIQASGRTAPEVSEDIRAKLAEGFVQKPSVTVVILQYRPFYILGEVNTPGQYEYAKGMTLLAAVARAGGFTYRARKSEVFLKHEGIPGEVRVRLDADVPIQPGDTIRVGERYF